jgi:hypothetical protein
LTATTTTNKHEQKEKQTNYVVCFCFLCFCLFKQTIKQKTPFRPGHLCVAKRECKRWPANKTTKAQTKEQNNTAILLHMRGCCFMNLCSNLHNLADQNWVDPELLKVAMGVLTKCPKPKNARNQTRETCVKLAWNPS